MRTPLDWEKIEALGKAIGAAATAARLGEFR